MLSSIIFIICLVVAVAFFSKNVRTIIRNINIGQDLDRTDQSGKRWKTMLSVAIGQSKMVKRPVAGLLHVVVYAGFMIINIEVLEIIVDGIFGSHRAFSGLGSLYTALIATFEVLALLTWLACAIFLVRRNIIRIKRFWGEEMTSWPRSDANIILFTEIALMSAFLLMNAADYAMFSANPAHMNVSGSAFPISSMLAGLLPTDMGALHMIERVCWWFHILGIFAFLNYLPYSKHFHIILAFPNVFYSNLMNKGAFNNLESVQNEVKMMFDPSVDPYAAPPEPDPNATPVKFGAKDVNDLSWKQLMDAYSCTECGRCTSECPANQTGKKLSPRKIVMDTRDRLEEYGKCLSANGKVEDGKSLLHDYITPEELWACTTCNACTVACPVNIDPLSTIIDLRRYLVMEESAANAELNGMFTNVENNGAPWQFSPMDRFNWASEE